MARSFRPGHTHPRIAAALADELAQCDVRDETLEPTPTSWQGGHMDPFRRSATVSWGAIVFGSALAITGIALILSGVVGGGVWFTVAAMVLLVASHVRNLIAARRRPPAPSAAQHSQE